MNGAGAVNADGVSERRALPGTDRCDEQTLHQLLQSSAGPRLIVSIRNNLLQRRGSDNHIAVFEPCEAARRYCLRRGLGGSLTRARHLV
jgi:hypothetical protein